ncbi:MAG: M23 family metallopeptidase [Acidobacteria bacterium]|nr:MAG: M23 family metallopeptidase [Acidobacteriota bacterium]
MNNKFYTLLISPGAHGRVRKIQLPFYVVPLVLSLSIIGVMMLAGLATSYARMLIKVSNYNTVRSEREALKQQFQTLETKVSRANVKLNSLQTLAAEVAVTYGFGKGRRQQITPDLLNLARQSSVGGGADGADTLYALNSLRTVSLSNMDDRINSGAFPGMIDDPGAIPAIWPVHGRITAGFGQRMDPFSGEDAFHPGVDIADGVGTDIVATGDGLVIEAEPDAGYGRSIMIDHGDGITTRYAHLSRIFVVVGEQVKQGEIIGAIGMSGRTTGPHLHYEVRIHGTPVNPGRFLHG